MPIPAIVGAGLSAAARVIAKNKKAREALVDFTKQLRKGTTKPLSKSVQVKALTGFPGGLGIGAGVSTVIMDEKLQKAKKAKKKKIKKSMTWNK